MTFTVDRTRSFLKIEALNLLSLYRSTHPVVPASDYCLGHLCDAFICVVHEYNLHRVYLALYDQQLKSNIVFIADPFRPDNKKLEALLLEAHGFLENIGFTMEEVNISFSTATREVIMKDIRVMREPSLDLQLEAAKMALEGLNAEKKEIIQKASREQMELKAELEDLRGQLIAATAAQQASMVEQSAKAENRGGSVLQVEQDALREEGEAVRLPLPDAEKELQQLQEELGSVKTMLKSTRENLKAAKEEVKQARKELKLSKHESDVINEKLKSGEMELARSRDEIDGARRQLQEARKAFEATLHDRGADNDDAEAARKTETAGLKAEIKRLTAELTGHDRAHAGEIEILRAALAEANVALSAEKAKIESALQEMEALERNATAELKSLKKKVDSLSAEKQLLEKIAADIKTKAHGEIERQQQVNQSQRKAAIKKLNALKEEIRQLAEARAVIASTTGMPLEQSGTKVSCLQADERKEIPIFSQRAGVSSDPFRSSESAGFMTTGMPLEQPDNKVSSLQADKLKELSFGSQQASFSSDPFGSAESTGSINFLPDKSLKGIPYSVSTDVVEVYRSYNTINVAPTGNRPQKCDGFVCLVTEGGKSQVYVAWWMNSSEKALVCLPECVAEGEDSCRRILGEGIAYFEKVGFLVDRVPLEEDPDKRQVQLDNLAVFSRTAMDCAA